MKSVIVVVLAMQWFAVAVETYLLYRNPQDIIIWICFIIAISMALVTAFQMNSLRLRQ